MWTESTGLPFVYAFWAGWPDALSAGRRRGAAARAGRGRGATSDDVARAYYPDDPGRQAVAQRYLRDNIQYVLGDEEREGLRTFYRYAAEAGLVPATGGLRFY